MCFPCIGEGKKYIKIQYPFFVPNTWANANHSTVQTQKKVEEKYKSKLHLSVIFL